METLLAEQSGGVRTAKLNSNKRLTTTCVALLWYRSRCMPTGISGIDILAESLKACLLYGHRSFYWICTSFTYKYMYIVFY